MCHGQKTRDVHVAVFLAQALRRFHFVMTHDPLLSAGLQEAFREARPMRIDND